MLGIGQFSWCCIWHFNIYQLESQWRVTAAKGAAGFEKLRAWTLIWRKVSNERKIGIRACRLCRVQVDSGGTVRSVQPCDLTADPWSVLLRAIYSGCMHASRGRRYLLVRGTFLFAISLHTQQGWFFLTRLATPLSSLETCGILLSQQSSPQNLI